MREICMLRSTRRGLETWHGRNGVTLADERARQRGTQTSTYTGAPVLDPTDERGWETGRCRMAQVTAPILDFYHRCIFDGQRMTPASGPISVTYATISRTILPRLWGRVPASISCAPARGRTLPTGILNFSLSCIRASSPSWAALTSTMK